MNHCAYERQSKPRNIEVKGLYGRWDVQLHATVDGGREYWWVENANGIDGEEGYWTTRNEAGSTNTSVTPAGATRRTPSAISKTPSTTEKKNVRPPYRVGRP